METLYSAPWPKRTTLPSITVINLADRQVRPQHRNRNRAANGLTINKKAPAAPLFFTLVRQAHPMKLKSLQSPAVTPASAALPAQPLPNRLILKALVALKILKAPSQIK